MQRVLGPPGSADGSRNRHDVAFRRLRSRRHPGRHISGWIAGLRAPLSNASLRPQERRRMAGAACVAGTSMSEPLIPFLMPVSSACHRSRSAPRQRPLKDLVLQRSDASGRAAHRALVSTPSATASPGMRPGEPERAGLEDSPRAPHLVGPLTPSTPGAAFGPTPEVRRSQAVDVDVVQERGEPRFLVLCATRRTRPRSLDTPCPALSPASSFAGRVPLGQVLFPPPPPPPRPRDCWAASPSTAGPVRFCDR